MAVMLYSHWNTTLKMWSFGSDFSSLVFQATAEQIRLAQMIYDKNDADFEDKVKQVMSLRIST